MHLLTKTQVLPVTLTPHQTSHQTLMCVSSMALRSVLHAIPGPQLSLPLVTPGLLPGIPISLFLLAIPLASERGIVI